MAEDVFQQVKATGFDLDKEGEHGDLAGYLGINLGKEADGSIHMTQTGLIEQIIEALGLEAAIPSTRLQQRCWGAIWIHHSFAERSTIVLLSAC